MTTTPCTGCAVQQGTHQPAEALHQQIDEPQSEALRLAAWLLHRGMSGIKQNDIEASNQLRWLHAESLQHKQELAASRFTVANREARIAELESQLEAIGAGGVEPLRKQAAAQQAVQAAVPEGWMLVPTTATTEMLDAMGTTGYAPDRYAAMLAAAPAHPAEGVPTLPEGWVPCVINYEGQHPEEIAYGPQIMMDRLKKWLDRYFEMRTHPTQQGLDAQALKQSFREYLSVSEHIDAGGHAMDSIATDLTRIVLAEEEVSAVIARRVHCNTSGQSGEDAENIRAAAQAKQGEQANG